MIHRILLPLLITVVVIGCKDKDKASAPKADLSTAEAAFHTYLTAIRSGDTTTALLATIGDPKSQKATLAQCNWLTGYAALKKALQTHNLPTAKQLGLEETLTTEGVAEAIDAALKSDIRGAYNDDKTRVNVTAKEGHRWQYSLQKVGNEWKVDHSELREFTEMEERAIGYSALAKAIEEGRVKTADEAKSYYRSVFRTK